MKKQHFLPTTTTEMKALGWQKCDIILVTGDTYIDHPMIGVSIIGRVLESQGYRVGIIAQPDCSSANDIRRLGEPALFWGITAGSVDSMVANYTALKKWRKSDDFTPGGINNRRPNRATIAYCNLIRTHFKNTRPLVIGGIEASLRRIAHYDFWNDTIRKSILVDAKADILVYGMAEKTVIELADHLKNQIDYQSIRGICYRSNGPTEDYIELPSYEEVSVDKKKFIEMFHIFYHNTDPVTAKGFWQKQDSRFVIQNPPAEYETKKELDFYHELPFTRAVHPFYEKSGKVKALETIGPAIVSHRGCYGECNFCAITVHQGRSIRWRTKQSLIGEVKFLAKQPGFHGIISDLSGPTANMYGFDCPRKKREGACSDKRCLFPEVCEELPVNHHPLIELMRSLRQIEGVKMVVCGSGIRLDLVAADKKHGAVFFRELTRYHVSGQLKIAPEHSEPKVLELMGKPNNRELEQYRELFMRFSRECGKEQYMTYYLMAAHPGCTKADMESLRHFVTSRLHCLPEQIQIFTPTPSTYSSLMFYTNCEPDQGRKIYVERDPRQRNRQKSIIRSSRK